MKILIIRMITSLCTVGLMTHACVLQAAAEFSDGLVPVELVRDITGGDVYRSLPDGFPLPGGSLPDGMTIRFVGSFDRVYQQEVYLRTHNDSNTVRKALADAYVAGGWTDVSSTPATLGAQYPITLPVYVSLCHDELGAIDINSNGTENAENKIVVRYRPPLRAPGLTGSCAEQRAYIDAGYPSGFFSFFMELIPNLEAPEDAMTAVPGLIRSPSIGISSSSSSGSTYRTSRRGEFSVSGYTSSQLFEHFMVQLEEQGWAVDNFVNADTASSSIWLKTAPAPDIPASISNGRDMELTGFLTIVGGADDSWQIQFEMFNE